MEQKPGTPHFDLMLGFYPRFNAGWGLSRQPEVFQISMGALFLALRHVSNAPRLGLACCSCGTIEEFNAPTKAIIQQKAWAHGWVESATGHWFCKHCDDHVPNARVFDAICRKFGAESVRVLNPKLVK